MRRSKTLTTKRTKQTFFSRATSLQKRDSSLRRNGNVSLNNSRAVKSRRDAICNAHCLKVTQFTNMLIKHYAHVHKRGCCWQDSTQYLYYTYNPKCLQ